MKLTSRDPEPPVGTRVRACGTVWERFERDDDSCYCWYSDTDIDGTDPASWIKVAGNYGPAELLAS